jgi:uncharacterized membrane protein YsdA (DUF1294 family)
MNPWLLFILMVINVFAFVYVGADKQKSIKGVVRFSEVSFFFIAVFFASLGILLGMFVFRHKIRKFYFLSGMVLLLLQQSFLHLQILPVL